MLRILVSGQTGNIMEDWVRSTVFSVQRGHSHFSPNLKSQILNDHILNICPLASTRYQVFDTRYPFIG